MKNCKYCGKENNKANTLFCSTKCSTSHYHEFVRAPKKNNAFHFIKSIFSKKKEEYSKLIIENKSSPTGKVYIGKATLPLMDSVTGFGYHGVLTQSENRNLVLCNECNMWFRDLCTHVRKHGMTSDEYREKHGLLTGNNLCCDELSEIRKEQIYSNPIITDKEVRKKRREATEPFLRGHGKSNKGRMEYRNTKGTCPEQLRHAVFEYIYRFKKLPTNTFSKRPTLFRRFGSFTKALQAYGLPYREKMGFFHTYVFPDGFMLKERGGVFEDGSTNIEKHLLERCPSYKEFYDSIEKVSSAK